MALPAEWFLPLPAPDPGARAGGAAGDGLVGLPRVPEGPPPSRGEEPSPTADRTYGQIIWRRFRADRQAMAGLCGLALVALLSVAGPWLDPWPFGQIHLHGQNLPPSLSHWFGTDALGRDIFARTWVGGRISLLVGLTAAGIDVCVGVALGTLAGLAGGAVDALVMRLVDTMYGVPFLLVAILLLVAVGPGLPSIVLAVALVNWLGMARLVRGQVLQLRSQPFVLAARGLGLPAWRVALRHILPNTLGAILVWLAFNVPSAMFLEAFLSYLGLGVQPPLPSWGSMISAGTGTFQLHPEAFLFPAAALCLTMLSFYACSDGLRDALDPRSRP